MPKDSVFTDEWRRCLRAHYMDVIRRNDQITLKSLVRVMHDTGFNDDELAEMRVRATMRADDMPNDFVPDPRVFQAIAENALPDEPSPDESYIEEISAASMESVEEVVAEVEAAEVLIEEQPPVEDEAKDDPDAPAQLSLF
jgi:hypothetical protein